MQKFAPFFYLYKFIELSLQIFPRFIWPFTTFQLNYVFHHKRILLVLIECILQGNFTGTTSQTRNVAWNQKEEKIWIICCMWKNMPSQIYEYLQHHIYNKWRGWFPCLENVFSSNVWFKWDNCSLQTFWVTLSKFLYFLIKNLLWILAGIENESIMWPKHREKLQVHYQRKKSNSLQH